MLPNELPFELGETLQGTDDNDNLINDHWLGQIFEVPANQYNASQVRAGKKRLVGRQLKVVALRNESGVTLYGGRLAALDTTAGYDLLKDVIGYATDTDQTNVVFIDHNLATDGVADDDIFWGILEGPLIAQTQETAASAGTIAVGNKLVAGTGAASSQATSAGGVGASATPGVASIVGTALSARASTQTNTDVLINACIRCV